MNFFISFPRRTHLLLIQPITSAQMTFHQLSFPVFGFTSTKGAQALPLTSVIPRRRTDVRPLRDGRQNTQWCGAQWVWGNEQEESSRGRRIMKPRGLGSVWIYVMTTWKEKEKYALSCPICNETLKQMCEKEQGGKLALILILCIWTAVRFACD